MDNLITKERLIAVTVSIFVIAGAVYWFLSSGPSESVLQNGENLESPTNFLRTEDLSSDTDMTDEDIEKELLNAFGEGRLVEALMYDIPGTDGAELVFAAPATGEMDEVQCGLQGEGFCGLYVRSADEYRLVLWGSRLVGFAGVESFPDQDHAIIATAWTLYGFTSIERNQLNLETGEIVPKLLMELDISDTFAELQVRGYGDMLSLRIEGEMVGGELIPERIYLQDDNGQTISELDDETIATFVDLVQASPADDPLQALFVMPSDRDINERTIAISLYDVPYMLDLTTEALVPLQSYEHGA